MHAGHVSNDLYNKSNIRDLTNFMVKEPIAKTDVLQCNLRKIRYIFCLIRIRNFLTNRDVFLRLAPLNFGKYIKYWHKWRKLLVFHIIVATIKHMLLDHARTLAECLVFMFNFDCTVDGLVQHKQWHNFRSQISIIFIQEVN